MAAGGILRNELRLRTALLLILTTALLYPWHPALIYSTEVSIGIQRPCAVAGQHSLAAMEFAVLHKVCKVRHQASITPEAALIQNFALMWGVMISGFPVAGDL